MEICDLVRALLSFDTLGARQWVADAARARLTWACVPEPSGVTPEELSVAAGVVELLAQRNGEPPPPWTVRIPSAPRRLYLVRAAETMPRLKLMCEREGPEPLRRRGIYAPPEFLTVA